VANDNQVMLVGNLTDDPELRFTPNGAAVANFRLAVTPRVRDGDSWKDGETSFFRINVWRQQAENVAETLQKGTRCIVVGRLRTRSWETPEGEKRSVTEVEADEIGPSLKFATAKVERSSRGGSGGSGGGGGGGDWAGSAAGASKGGQFNDEPPF
jgi:single-strand DNA-binding protein